MGNESETEVLIIGSGIAGSLIADRLCKSGIKVHILEAGDTIERGPTVDRFKKFWSTNTRASYIRHQHALFPDPTEEQSYLETSGGANYWVDYLRGTGGTTWHWSGITPRFVPTDFKSQSHYSIGHDWPIAYDDIEPYYLHAEHEMGISGDSDHDHGSPRSGPYPMPAIAMPYADQQIDALIKPHGHRVQVFPAARNSLPYQNRPACCGSGSCSPICPTAAQYNASIHLQKAIKQGARLSTNTIAYELISNPDGEISAVRCKRPDGSLVIHHGKKVILACNSIETPKLLLISRSISHGIANSSGLVGKNLMDHPVIGSTYRSRLPLYYGRGPLTVSTINNGRDGTFRKQRAAGKISLFNRIDNRDIILEGIEKNKQWADIDTLLQDHAIHSGVMGVELEMLANPDNQVSANLQRLDTLGIPQPDIHFKIDAYTNAGAQYFRQFFSRIIKYIGADKTGDIELGKIWPNHPMGTTIMGHHKNSSVVNSHCQTHDHSNLYIAGSSVFTTGGTANPTLTIAALSLRLADHLIQELSANN